MTLKSMTGFGRGEGESNGRLWTAEIRCVNNRFLDIKIKLPKGYTFLEEPIRKRIAENHQRGRVDVVINVQGDFSDLQRISFNSTLASAYQDALAELAKSLQLPVDTALSQLAAYPDVLVREQQDEDFEKVWQTVDVALCQALENCDNMRRVEGGSLYADLQERLSLFITNLEKIENLIPELIDKRQKTLQERLARLLGGVELDPVRLSQEVAVMADKTDVTEEIVRLKSHIVQFRKTLNEENAIGRKLDFLIQEFLREVNTLASKINDAETAHLSVDLKSELEKIREQVQNIE